MIRYKFSRTLNSEFAAVLRQRVRAYFKDNNLSQKGNQDMYLKTVVALSFYFLPFLVILFSGITYLPVLFLLWMCMGFGKAVMGTSVMHDVLHGSYSSSKRLNWFMHLTPLVIGAYPRTWKLQHNVLHHTYTNIEHNDEDLTPIGVLRFSPNQDLKWFHKYQHLYATFFYCIMTLIWATAKDFVRITKYRNMGLLKSDREFVKNIGLIIFSKTFYFSLILGLPIMLLPIPTWQILLMFLCMHLVAGFVLSMVFQLAHIMPDIHFLEQEEQDIEQNWLVHQLETTSNYAMKNKFITWIFGGLNHQVEHHLFPNVCHVHYPQISRIVQKTTKEFGLPYHKQRYFGVAIVEHYKMLKALGSGQVKSSKVLV
ncbi:MAG: fatty acid desaturase [Bacteroidota bacterium]